MNILAVGDIHTKIEIVETVRKYVNQYDKIVFIGDYADDWGKGPLATLATWEAIYELQRDYPNKIVTIIGNHDYAYILPFNPGSGGYNRQTQLLLNMPEHKNIKDWLTNMPISVELDGVTYSHAGIAAQWEDADNPYDLWSDVSPLWLRPNYAPYKDGPQVFGHTPMTTCLELYPNIWCIDTMSTYPAGDNIGDSTMLEIKNGKDFQIVGII